MKRPRAAIFSRRHKETRPQNTADQPAVFGQEVELPSDPVGGVRCESQGSLPRRNEFSEQSVGIYHDYFAIRGGGERLVLTLARELQATLIYGYRSDKSFEVSAFPPDTRALAFPAALRREGVRSFALSSYFWGERTRARDYRVRIFSGVAAPFAAPPKGCGGVNIFYCHTPPRFLYDKRAHFLAQLGWPARILAPVALKVFGWAYRRAVERMDVIVTNSETTQARVAKYLGRDSAVVHPPIDTELFVWKGQGDYYLSTARLTSLKRVGQIVEAFLRMPHKKLIVASGGEDADLLRAKAASAPNIEFRGWVSDAEIRDLVGNSIATIYVPMDEDFGMSPVESMAAGKPVIGVAEGGLQETVLPNETGLLLNAGFTVNDLVDAVSALAPERALLMRRACEARALLFSKDKFINGIRRIIDDASRRPGDTA